MKTKIKKLLGLVALGVVLALTMQLTMAAVSPSRGSSVSSWSEFLTSSPFAANYVIDRPTVWVPFNGGFQGTVASLVGLATGTPVWTEVNTSGVGGYLLDADSESVVAGPFPISPDIDLSKDIDMRVLWSNSDPAATGSALFACTYEILTIGTSTIGAGEPDDALDTVITTDVDLAANVTNLSPWGTIAGGTITVAAEDNMLIVKCNVDLTTIANATVYGLQIRHYRKFLGSPLSAG